MSNVETNPTASAGVRTANLVRSFTGGGAFGAVLVFVIQWLTNAFGPPDLTPFLFVSTLVLMAIALPIAFCCHLVVRKAANSSAG